MTSSFYWRELERATTALILANQSEDRARIRICEEKVHEAKDKWAMAVTTERLCQDAIQAGNKNIWDEDKRRERGREVG